MTEFILNDQLVRTECPAGLPLLDFIRCEAGLSGTKCGCREGDCGACTVMEGVWKEGIVRYHTIVSCLTPLESVHGKHIVTIEGIAGKELHPIQQAIIDQSATQCGFCTPGIVMSLVSASLSGCTIDPGKIKDAIGGNICRCTGYKSIEKAAKIITGLCADEENQDIISLMVERNYLPHWFLSIPGRIAQIAKPEKSLTEENLIIGGGTDLMVQQAEKVLDSGLTFTGDAGLKGIDIRDGECILGSALTLTGIMHSDALLTYFPDLEKCFRLISSEQIRNMGTLGGNLVNASPIADLAILFLALDASLVISDWPGNSRTIPLGSFFLGYKRLDLRNNEYVKELKFRLPGKNDHFNFEKVSKREHLDIASVNSAVLISVKDDTITNIHLSAGGVAPVPKFLMAACNFLKGKPITVEYLRTANQVMQGEISPISDIRGSADYKRLLLRQLLFSHFYVLFPREFDMELLIKSCTVDEKL